MVFEKPHDYASLSTETARKKGKRPPKNFLTVSSLTQIKINNRWLIWKR